MLSQVRHHREPFEHFTAERALPEPSLRALAALFEAPHRWEHHHDTFYRAYLCDVSERLSPELRGALVERLSALTGLPLLPRVKLTIQRMEPGQYAGPHTDRPLLGYEAARLIVQLNRAWRPAHGGALHLHADAEGRSLAAQLLPTWGSAFGFVMGPRSFHSVQTVHQERRTAVFNVWHAGNSEALAAWVRRQLDGARFADLPRRLDPLIQESERSMHEAHTARAAHVALLLLRWGYPEDVVEQGYRRGLQPLDGAPDAPAVLFARWIERLAHQDFDAALWAALQPLLGGDAARADPRLAEGLALAFPGA